jgi:hypothetical protein
MYIDTSRVVNNINLTYLPRYSLFLGQCSGVEEHHLWLSCSRITRSRPLRLPRPFLRIFPSFPFLNHFAVEDLSLWRRYLQLLRHPVQCSPPILNPSPPRQTTQEFGRRMGYNLHHSMLSSVKEISTFLRYLFWVTWILRELSYWTTS